MPARAIGLAVRYSELLVAEQLGNTTFGTARHITTTLNMRPCHFYNLPMTHDAKVREVRRKLTFPTSNNVRFG